MNPFRALSDTEICDLVLDHLANFARSNPEAPNVGNAGARISALRRALMTGTAAEVRQAGVHACAGITSVDMELADPDTALAYQGAREVIIRYCSKQGPDSWHAAPGRTPPGQAG